MAPVKHSVRRVQRPILTVQEGNGLLKGLKKIGKFVKKNKLISRGLQAGQLAGYNTGMAGNTAGQLGFGRKKRVQRRRR